MGLGIGDLISFGMNNAPQLWSAGSTAAMMPLMLMDYFSAKNANEARYGEAKGLLSNLYDRQMPQIENLSRDIQGRMEGQVQETGKQWTQFEQGMLPLFDRRQNQLMSEADRRLAEGTAFANQRYSEGMDILARAGEQERRDINSQYDALAGETMQQLTSRGLGGTTVLPAMRAGVERQRSDAMGRLNDRLTQQRSSVHAGLSGDALNTLLNLTGARMGTLGETTGQKLAFQTEAGQGRMIDVLGAQNAAIGSAERLGQIPLAYDQQLLGNIVNLIGQRQDTYSDPSQMYAAMMGAGANMQRPAEAPKPDRTSGWMGLAGGVGGAAITTKGTLLAATIMAGGVGTAFCVSGNSTILLSEGGAKTLRNVSIGDTIETPVGPATVIALSFGRSREDDFIEITSEDGRTLIVTYDHLIPVFTGDDRTTETVKPAFKIGVGDTVCTRSGFLKVQAAGVAKRNPPTSGDLMLVSTTDPNREIATYWANGIAVVSMFRQYCPRMADAMRDSFRRCPPVLAEASK